jgi:hypothetical protein
MLQTVTREIKPEKLYAFFILTMLFWVLTTYRFVSRYEEFGETTGMKMERA